MRGEHQAASGQNPPPIKSAVRKTPAAFACSNSALILKRTETNGYLFAFGHLEQIKSQCGTVMGLISRADWFKTVSKPNQTKLAGRFIKG